MTYIMNSITSNKYTWCLTSTEPIRLIRVGEAGGRWGEGVWRWELRGIIYLSLHFHHQNDSCIKMGSDDSHYNVSLIVKDKVTRQCPQTTTFEKKDPQRIGTEVRLGAYQPNALPLGQTGSRCHQQTVSQLKVPA